LTTVTLSSEIFLSFCLRGLTEGSIFNRCSMKLRLRL
jgi:hypothetical protein